MLSKMYGNGEGLPKSEADESKWLLKAAESGHPKAQYEYGRRIGFYFGKRDPGRDAESIKWIRKSADQGYAPALVALATCFYLGDGVAESYNSCFRREFADRWWFHNYDDIAVAMGDWLRDYNRYRPHGSLGFKTPEEFAGKPVDRRAHLLTLVAA